MSKPLNFSTPHCHVQSLDSGSTPEAFIKRELELGTGAVTCTDHGTLIACRKVYDLAHKAGIVPILGLEGYFRDDNCSILKANGVSNIPAYWSYGHFTTHFKNQQAFEVGTRLLSSVPTEKHGTEAKPLFGWAELEELCSHDVTITTGCLIGILGRHLLKNDRPDIAKAYLDKLIGITKPGQLIVELFPHVCSHNFVNAVFLVSKGADKPRKYHKDKWLRTNVGEIRAWDLASEYKKGKHTHLLAVKNYHTWEEFTPEELVSVDHLDGEVENECRPWSPTSDVQLGVNSFLLELAEKHNLPVLVSDDSHFAYPDEKIVQEVRLAQSGNLRFTGSYHRQSSDEAWQYFSKVMNIPEAKFDRWVDYSKEWTQTFKGFKFSSKLELPVKFWEASYAAIGATDSVEYIMYLVEKHGRMDWNNEVWVARLKQEIDLFRYNGTLDVLPYFYIDEEACEVYTKAGEITGVGRGSAAGVLLMYLLNITHADPIKWGLSLNRFMTEDRIKSGKFPDVDQDLPHRDLITKWLEERFGDHSAQISTVATLRLSSAVLDVARFKLGRVPPDIIALSKAFERPPQGVEDDQFVHGYEDSGVPVQGSIDRDPALKEYVRKYPEHWEIVKKCLGLARSAGRHASAFLVANRPIKEFIPTMDIGGVRCTQFTASAVEASGGLKMDFLIVDVLKDIAEAIKLVQERTGVSTLDFVTINGKSTPRVRCLPLKNGQLADIWDLPEEQAVFDDLAQGKTETVFQFDTDGVRQWIKQFNHKKADGTAVLDSVAQMAVFTALDRPGPLDALVSAPGQAASPIKSGVATVGLNISGADNTGVGAVSPRSGGTQDDGVGKHNVLVEYAHRARGLARTPDLLPVFDELFPETYGLMVFQEQMQAAYQRLTGCSGSEAETFRSYVAKKNKEKIIAAYPDFIEKASKTLGSKEEAQAVWDLLNAWSSYGFCKAHAASYAVTAYACAYLKHHYPLEWWCATLRFAGSKRIKEKLWKHCHSIVKMPSIKNVVDNYTIIGDSIQAPLSLLEGLGDAANSELVRGAPYLGMNDFLERKEKTKEELGRSNVHSGVIEKMMLAGAFDDWYPADSTLVDKLTYYQTALYDRENAARQNVGKRAKKAPNPVDSKYLQLNSWNLFQLKKRVLPGAWMDLLDLVPDSGVGSVKLKGNYLKCCVENDEYVMVDLAGYRALRDGDVPNGGKTRAIIVYVKAAEVFQYKDKSTGEPKEALKVLFDLEGEEFEILKWSDKSGKLPKRLKQSFADSAGAIATILVNKWKTGKDITIVDVEIIEPPLKLGEEKNE